MELYQKNNYGKIFRKNHFKTRDSFNQYKRSYNSNIYNNNEEFFQQNYQKNKVIQKTSFYDMSPTEKNSKLNDININKNYNENNNENMHISFNIEKMKQKSNIEQFIKLNNMNNNYNNNTIAQISKINPYYNFVNNNYYLNLYPNYINNYYINNNIIIQNNTCQYPNLYSILNSDNHTIKAINPYLSNNNFNYALFSKNETNISDSINNNILDPKKENTCILEINVKFGKDKIYSFKLKRFDDLFETVQIFCQIYELNSNFYMPIINNIIKALNCIYGIYNIKLSQKEINELMFLKHLYYITKVD